VHIVNENLVASWLSALLALGKMRDTKKVSGNLKKMCYVSSAGAGSCYSMFSLFGCRYVLPICFTTVSTP